MEGSSVNKNKYLDALLFMRRRLKGNIWLIRLFESIDSNIIQESENKAGIDKLLGDM